MSGVLSVTSVWGTTVVSSKVLRRGESFALPIGEATPLLPQAGAWELDPTGALGGLVSLRGREENAKLLAQRGDRIPLLPGDFGLLQYGQFAIFFQWGKPLPRLRRSMRMDLFVSLALLSSFLFHLGILGLVRRAEPSLPRPIELTDPDERALRFGLRRRIFETPPPPKVEALPKGEKSTITPTERPRDAKADAARTARADKPTVGDLDKALAESGLDIRRALSQIPRASDVAKDWRAEGESPFSGTSPSGKSVPFYGGDDPRGGFSGDAGAKPSPEGRGVDERGVRPPPSEGPRQGGLTQQEIARVVSSHAGALRACYEIEAQKNPGLKGNVTVSWSIEPGGTVSTAAIASSTLSNPRVEGCVLRQVRRWTFPKSDTASRATFPFRFGMGR